MRTSSVSTGFVSGDKGDAGTCTAPVLVVEECVGEVDLYQPIFFQDEVLDVF